MMMKKTIATLLAAVLFQALQVDAQPSSATLYFMSGLPQRSWFNPAFQPESRFFMGSPGFSQVHFLAGNTGFSFNDIIVQGDSFNTIDPGAALAVMPGLSQLYTDFTYQPISFGFRLLKRGYLTFDMSPRISFQYVYPRDLPGFLWKGNAHSDYLGKRINLDNMGVEFSVTNQFSLGYSHKVMEGLYVGVRGRYIQGIANIHTERFTGGLSTDATDFTLTADLDARISYSLPAFIADSLENFNPGAYDADMLKKEGLAYVNKNRGLGFDLGVSYLFMERFLFSASVNDIGYIRWQGNPTNLQSTGTFTFDGFDFSSMVIGDTASEPDFEELLDSIADIFKVDTTYQSYSQRLQTSWNAGFGFYLTRDDVVGLLWQNQFYHGGWFPRVTLSYNHRFGRVLSLSANYGIERGNYRNVGAGIALKLGPMQYYLISDNILFFVDPLSSKQFGFLTGVNWLIGRTEKKQSIPSI